MEKKKRRLAAFEMTGWAACDERVELVRKRLPP